MCVVEVAWPLLMKYLCWCCAWQRHLNLGLDAVPCINNFVDVWFSYPCCIYGCVSACFVIRSCGSSLFWCRFPKKRHCFVCNIVVSHCFVQPLVGIGRFKPQKFWPIVLQFANDLCFTFPGLWSEATTVEFHVYQSTTTVESRSATVSTQQWWFSSGLSLVRVLPVASIRASFRNVCCFLRCFGHC